MGEPTQSPQDEAAKIMAAKPQKPIRWINSMDLKYESIPVADAVCFRCGTSASEIPLSRCSRCKVASYCKKSCQIDDWKKGGHKVACSSYARVGRGMIFQSESEQDDACQEIFARLRFYACPYAVYKASELGKGFLFVQSDNTLAMMSLGCPKDSAGHPPIHPRAVLIHYLTIAEYDQEVCRADFEMTMLREDLQTTVEAYNNEEEVVLLMKFRCGRVVLGVAPLAPEFGLCRQLGQEYYENTKADSLHLNLDGDERET